MKALVITRFGGPEVLELQTKDDPSPGEGEVRIRVERAGLNFADLSARVGLYPDAPKPPMVVGYEVAGVVDAVGPKVTSVRPGDRVLGVPRFGGQADTLVLPEAQVAAIPPQMSFDDAAALPVNYLTAYHMLFHVHVLKPREKVLLHGAGGGVGIAVIQLCRLVEGVEIFGTASAAKHPLLRDLGVQHPIDYRTEDYAAVVRRLTHGRGVDLVLDPLGGGDWAKGYQLLAPAGQLIAYGWSNMVSGERRNLLRVGSQLLQVRPFTPLGLMDHNRTMSGVNMGHLWGETALLRGHLNRLLDLYAAGKIAPRVDKVFPLSQGADAYRYLQERRNVGKVLFDCTR
ncbi:MAG: zinc-binding dehydrogenase [Myxococcaceae bacterium]|nr:zinc-binding dehydrogenase [Myxococcaceae bacterium]